MAVNFIRIDVNQARVNVNLVRMRVNRVRVKGYQAIKKDKADGKKGSKESILVKIIKKNVNQVR